MKLTNQIELAEESNEIIVFAGGRNIRIKVENQLLQILLLLAMHKGEPVEKRVFIDRIWQGNDLTGDGALTKNIFKLRELFRIHKLEGMIGIETIPKKGYRLIVSNPGPVLKPNTFKRKTVFAIGIIVLAFLTTGYLLFNEDYESPSVTKTIIGDDTVIQLGKNKVMIIDPDTAKSPITLND